MHANTAPVTVLKPRYAGLYRHICGHTPGAREASQPRSGLGTLPHETYLTYPPIRGHFCPSK